MIEHAPACSLRSRGLLEQGDKAMAEDPERPGLSRKLLAVEWLKAEMLSQIGSLFRSLVTGTADAVMDSLAGVLISVYVLGMRLGINPARLEQRAMGRLTRSIQQEQEMEMWFGDLTRLYRHLARHDES